MAISRSYHLVINTREIVVISFLILSCALSHAQKIQVKKGIVLNEGVAVARLEGEATLFKGTDITIKSITNEPLLHIKSVMTSYHSVFYEAIQFYVIDFIPMNKSATLIIDYPFSSEKNLIAYLYTTLGADFFSNDGLNKSQIDNFIAGKDESGKINADTIRTFAMRNNERERLQHPVEPRDLNAPVVLNRIDARGSEAASQDTFDVYQGNMMIAMITKTITSSTVAYGGTPTRSCRYEVMRKVTPFSVDGKNFEYAHITLVKANPDFPLDITSYCNGTWAKDLKLVNILSGERQIISWLIEKGCI